MDLNLAQTSQAQQAQVQQAPAPPIKLTDVKVTDENVALNLLVSFISLAQKRGTFTIDESAKIWECISTFTTFEKSGAKPLLEKVKQNHF
jgi:ABC-type transporter Mla MlaB component